MLCSLLAVLQIIPLITSSVTWKKPTWQIAALECECGLCESLVMSHQRNDHLFTPGMRP